MNKVVHIAIFASGAGSNAEKIIQYFAHSADVKVSLILCNKENAGVFKIAEENNIEGVLINKTDFLQSDKYVGLLKEKQIDLVILAGFLWKIPQNLLGAFPERIINIHPALLPKYGGKGMYGHFVHEAVIANKEKESGITVHLADEQYDHGQHLFQAVCKIEENDTSESLAEKIHLLEHQYYPTVIDKFIRENLLHKKTS